MYLVYPITVNFTKRSTVGIVFVLNNKILLRKFFILSKTETWSRPLHYSKGRIMIRFLFLLKWYIFSRDVEIMLLLFLGPISTLFV